MTSFLYKLHSFSSEVRAARLRARGFVLFSLSLPFSPLLRVPEAYIPQRHPLPTAYPTREPRPYTTKIDSLFFLRSFQKDQSKSPSTFNDSSPRNSHPLLVPTPSHPPSTFNKLPYLSIRQQCSASSDPPLLELSALPLLVRRCSSLLPLLDLRGSRRPWLVEREEVLPP